MKILIGFFILGLLALVACEKDQYSYRKFINDKELIYAGLAENFISASGRLRVQLQWTASIDPSVVSYTIYWNNNIDSAVVPATTVDPDGVYKYTVNGLPEYVQSFKIVAQNDRGYRSVGQTLNSVRVFGPVYTSALNNHKLDSMKRFSTDSVRLYFFKTDTSRIFSKLHYYKKDGNLDSISFKTDSVTIKSYMPDTKPAIRSYYLPTANAIDTFSTLTVDSLLAF